VAASGPTKITAYINRSDACGWTMNFYTSTADLTTAETQAQNLLTLIQAQLADDTQIVGVRYTDTNNPRKSILRHLTVNTPTTGGELDPDERTVCASFSLLNTAGQKEIRTFRGFPDAWVLWEGAVVGMQLNPNAVASITLLVQELTNSRQQTYGWLPRLRKNDLGSSTSDITALGANPFGNATLTVASTTPFNTNPRTPIIVGGMRGMQKFLNGTYLPTAYVVVNATTLGLVSRQIGAGAISSYSGQGTVRLASPTFVPYRPNQAVPTTAGLKVALVRARDTGRPFFLTHGRR
jgi:hypothetical protein